MNFLTLAAKNLLRRRGRTLLTVMGVAIAISVLFSLLALNSGYEKELNKEVNSLGAHILAVPKGCPYEAASLVIHGGVIPKYLSEADLHNISKIEGIELATPMLMHQFIRQDAKTGKDVPHIVYGIKIDEMRALKPWWKVQGRYFTDNETNVMLVGRGLADKENLTVGMMLPAGPFKNFTIIGILDRIGDQDDNFHFVPLAEVQRVFNKQGKITTVAVKVKDINQISEISDEMEKIPDIQVVTMTQIMGTIMNLAGSAKIAPAHCHRHSVDHQRLRNHQYAPHVREREDQGVRHDEGHRCLRPGYRQDGSGGDCLHHRHRRRDRHCGCNRGIDPD